MSNRDDLKAIGISSSNSKNTNMCHTNNVANIIKILAIMSGFAGAILGFSSIDKSDFAILIIVASVISAVFIYALGEIIQLLEDIKNK